MYQRFNDFVEVGNELEEQRKTMISITERNTFENVQEILLVLLLVLRLGCF